MTIDTSAFGQNAKGKSFVYLWVWHGDDQGWGG